MRLAVRRRWKRCAWLPPVLAACLLPAAPAWGDSYVYVANLDGSISQFGRGEGRLAPNPAAVDTGVGLPMLVAVSPNGRSVYVVKNDGAVLQYDVRADGTVAPKPNPAVSTRRVPTALAISPDGRSLYVAGQDANDRGAISQFSIDASTGALSPMAPTSVPAGTSPSGIAVSGARKSVYVTSLLDGTIAQHDVGPGGALSPKDPPTVANGGGPNGVAVSADGRSVYIGELTGHVAQYKASPTGALSAEPAARAATRGAPHDLAISPDGRSLYVVNGGLDPAGDTISQYSLDPTTGAPSPKNPATVPTGREPAALTVTGRSVYVTSFDDGTVSQYDVDPDGTLTPGTPPTVTAGQSAHGVAVSPDGSSVYVAAPDDRRLLAYRTARAGALTPLAPAAVQVSGDPYGIAVGRTWGDVTHLYATNGAVAGRVSQYVVGLGGLLSAVRSVSVGAFPRAVAVAPAQSGESVFAADQADNTLHQSAFLPGMPGDRGIFETIDPRTAAAGRSPAGVAVGPHGAYVTNRADDTVSQYGWTQAEWTVFPCIGDGCPNALVPKSPASVAAGDAPFGVVVHPAGSSVYVTNAAGNSISQYTADASGALAPKTPATVATGHTPLGVAVSTDGRSVYVANQGSDSISQYTVDATTGVLSPKSPATVPAGSEPTAVAVSADGKAVYVTNLDDGTVSQYDIGADGALAPMQPATVTAGKDPYAIAVTADIPRKVGRAIRVARRAVRVNRRRVAAIPVRCPTRLDRCRVRITLRRVGSPRVIARGRVTVRGAQTARAPMRLSRSAFRALKRRGHLRASVTARSRHAAGNRSRDRSTIILRAPARRSRDSSG